MPVRQVELTDFRNYERAEVSFEPGLNVVVGSNAQGKTNLLEAIYFCARLGSWRPGPNASLVRTGAARSIIRLSTVDADDRKIGVDVEIASSGYRALVNRVPLDRAEAGALPLVVLFSPEDLDLVKGPPEGRRKFLDHLAASVRPMAQADRRDFDKALRQRNGLLKAAQHNQRALKSLDVWDERLVRSGTALIVSRLRALEPISRMAPDHHRAISQEPDDLALAYTATWTEEPSEANAASDLAKAIEANRASDLDRGLTQVGPHRDDLQITLGSSDARTFSSQGQQRTTALALRLAERQAIVEARSRAPTLLLDDVFSELDDQRRGRLADLVSGDGQTIATSTSIAGIPMAPNRVMSVAGGKVEVDE